MSAIDCAREQELLDALARQRWPGAVRHGPARPRRRSARCAATPWRWHGAPPQMARPPSPAPRCLRPASSGGARSCARGARRSAPRAARSRSCRPSRSVCGAVSVASLAFWVSPALPNWRDCAAADSAECDGHRRRWSWPRRNVAGVRRPWLILGMWIVLIPLAIYLAVADD